MQIRRRQILFGLGALFLMTAAAASAADKVGYINLQRLVSESKTGKEAREDIQKMRKAKEDELTRRLESLNKMKDELNENWEKLDARTQRDRRAELKRAYEDYQKMLTTPRRTFCEKTGSWSPSSCRGRTGCTKKSPKETATRSF